jgi:hypothetical protein
VVAIGVIIDAKHGAVSWKQFVNQGRFMDNIHLILGSTAFANALNRFPAISWGRTVDCGLHLTRNIEHKSGKQENYFYPIQDAFPQHSLNTDE